MEDLDAEIFNVCFNSFDGVDVMLAQETAQISRTQNEPVEQWYFFTKLEEKSR